VLDLHGWGDVQTDLNRLSKAGDWRAMGERIDDEMLATFAVVADPEDVAPRLAERYGDVVTRVTLALPHGSEPDRWSAVIAAIKAI
jgi:alkanesulfonate monooxygenase SsuD/methylene tetrahydromethanopterin reductase-like flavin-dependent oxidoreductase (luciferase family)